MKLERLVEVCKEYADLGTTIQQQLDRVVANQSEETVCDQNANALRIADERFLSQVQSLADWQDDDELLNDVIEVREAIKKGQA